MRRIGVVVANAVFLLAAIVTIFANIRPIHKPVIKPSASAVPSGSATAQSSSDFQSSNLSGDQHNVQILYGSTVVNNTPPPVSSNRRVISQSSTGDQSPNINGVDGNVDIHY